jgi:hypothetical protein
MKRITLLIGIFTWIFLPSCRYHCQGFPESELKYIPYKLDDTIMYYNNLDTINLIVSDYYKSENHLTERMFPVMDLWCEEKAYYQTDRNPIIDCYIREEYDAYELFKVEFNDNNVFSFSLFNDSQYKDGIIKKSFNEQIEINGKIYHNCITLEKNKQIYVIWKIVKADSVGIIEFYHNKYQDSWKLIN